MPMWLAGLNTILKDLSMTKFPYSTNWVLQAYLAALLRDQFSYIEPGFGVEGFKLGPLICFEWICFGAFKTGITKKMALG